VKRLYFVPDFRMHGDPGNGEFHLMRHHLHFTVPLFLGMLALSCEKSLLGPDRVQNPPPQVYPDRLATVLDSLRYVLDLPALAGAVMTDTGVIDAEAVGCRRYGGPKNVTNTDCFHLGSCGKSFTSVLMGLLVDEGRVQWTSTLSSIFPEYATSMRPEYIDVTIRDLLSHSAGFCRDVDIPLHGSTPREQRVEVVSWAFHQPPAQQRGRYLYSNLGYVIAGAIIERVADGAYEDLLMQRVVRPLGLTTAGIGQMGSEGLEDQPLQHTPSHAPIIATPDAHLAPFYDPAGMLHMSVGDWGRYCRWVLACEAGRATLLRPETEQMITSPAVSTGDGGAYALGWGILQRSWANGTALTHSGSNGYNYAEVALAPGRKFGVVVMTNEGAGVNANPTDPAVMRLIDYYVNGEYR
jgi:CubicO group peptidase (beta-lactamase class C family)